MKHWEYSDVEKRMDEKREIVVFSFWKWGSERLGKSESAHVVPKSHIHIYEVIFEGQVTSVIKSDIV